MFYVIYSEDVADSLDKRQSVRPAHLARLQLLQDEGRLLTAGPMPAVDSNDRAPPVFRVPRSLLSLNPVKPLRPG